MTPTTPTEVTPNHKDNHKESFKDHRANTTNSNASESVKSSREDSGSPQMVSWRGIFVGSAVALLTYSGLLAFGLALGGSGLQGVAQGMESLSALGTGAAIWMILSLSASLYVGGWVANRAHSSPSRRLGVIQGLAVSAIVSLVLLSQLGAGLAALGNAAAQAVGTAGKGGAMAAQNPEFQQVVEDALGGQNLKSPPEVVASGVATRLLSGETESALTYYAGQTGVSREEARARVYEMSRKLKEVGTNAAMAAAKALKFAGWFLFAMMGFGTLAATRGGRMAGGSRKDRAPRNSARWAS